MSNLNTLLKYRFVRKSSDKLQKSDGSGSDQDSNSNSSQNTQDKVIPSASSGDNVNKSFSGRTGNNNLSSDGKIYNIGPTGVRNDSSSESSQNSPSILDHGYSAISKQNIRVAGRQNSVQNESVVSSSSEKIIHKQWDNDVTELIRVPIIDLDKIIDLDSASNSPKVNAVPETPASQLPSPPGSPVFSTKNRAPQRIVIEDSDEEDTASKESSPWLSKEQGKEQLTNGVVPGPFNRRKSKHKTLPDLSDSDEEPLPSSASPKLTAAQQDNVHHLKQMFPQHSKETIRISLVEADWDIESATDILINQGSNIRKKKRIQRMDSSDSDIATPPRKRIRPVQSSESQETEIDSQATQIYSNSQVALDDNVKEERIKFLSEAFEGKSRRELYRVLDENDWDIERATVSLSTAPEKADQKLIDAMEDEDENFDSGDEGAASDDSFEEEGEGAKTQKEIILSFFEESTLEELMGTPRCSKKKAELIMSQRPLESWENMVAKFTTTKGLSYDIISGCKEIIHVRNVINNLMAKCEKISEEMGSVVAYLTRKTTELDNDGFDDAIQITKQPKLLNESLTLKPYQMVGLNWLRIMHTQDLNGILADEMGLGKTIQTIAFLAHLLEEGDDGPHVIIVPSSTIENWIRELDAWCPSLSYIVYYGSQEDRRSIRQSVMYDRDTECNVLLTTYNMATGGVEDRTLFKKFEFHYAVFDEGHMLKNMSSLRYQNLMKINAERRLLLTGTPLQNNLLELMSLLCFVMPNMFIGKTDHLRKMFTMIAKTDDKRSKFEAERIAHAKRIMRPFVLRRLKSEVLSQLPTKHEEIITCPMIPDQQEIYDRLVAKFSKEIRDHADQDDYKGGASMLMQLRKVANHPLLVRHIYNDVKLHEMSKAIAKEPSHQERGALPHIIKEDMEVMHDFEIYKLCKFYKTHIGSYKLDMTAVAESGKFRELENLLTTMKSQKDRVVIFSQFTMMMDIMEEFFKLNKYRYIRLDGSTPVVERQQLIDEFNTDENIFLFMISTRAGGLGINLTSANVAIIHDIDFNPYNDKQAEDRIHRVGQTREVRVIRLVSKDTVEEAMLRCAQEKLKLEKDVTTDQGDDTENPKDVVSLLKEALREGKT